jgi:aminodeoxyfutalosine deaminase
MQIGDTPTPKAPFTFPHDSHTTTFVNSAVKPQKILLKSSWVAPMDRPAFRDGGVVIAGSRLLATGAWADMQRDHPEAIIEDLGAALILPGLVNAHVHLELSCAPRMPDPASFVTWIEQVMTLVPPGGDFAAFARDGLLEGWRQCGQFGVTSVGDITRQHHVTRSIDPMNNTDPFTISYGEIQAMAQRRGLLEERLIAAADTSHTSPRRQIGISPHAPYSIEPEGYRRSLALARQRHLPIATHLAEDLDEARFLAEHSGPFRDLWSFLNAWDDAVPRFAGGPIRYAKSLGLLDYPTLLAHVNYCDDDELALLAAGQASVVYCPRTHRYFSRPPHRFREMLARGINVALGTDSCASSPDLNLVDDLRLVHKTAPEIPAPELWRLITTRAAKAIGATHVGALIPGYFANLIAFPTSTHDPLTEILESNVLPRKVWIAGSPLTSPLPPYSGGEE